MRSFKDLTEATDNAVFTLGRFNPPTTGHEKLIKKLSSKAGRDPMYVFPTHTQDPKRNPLPHTLKVAYMKKMFRKHAKDIQTSTARNVFEVAKILYDKGHKSVTMVVGSDRVAEFSSLLKKYNGTKSTHGFYEFDNINVVSAGERDPDSEGVEGMSASKMRAAAQDGKKDDFMTGLPSSFKDGEKLYRDVRSNMGVREERDMGDMTDFEYLRDQYLTGKVWKLGDQVEANNVKGEVVRRGTNYLTMVEEDGKVHKVWLHDITLDERNYRKEYDNYQGKPDQVARRSSRNKARRVMGDKTKVGMDVGHKDNDPMNNDPKNLKNENPSKNRREPRLREKLAKTAPVDDYIDDFEKSDAPQFKGKSKKKRRDMALGAYYAKQRGESLGEMSWFPALMAKLSQMKHPTGFEGMAKAYAKKMREKKYKGKPGLAVSDVALQTKNISPRALAVYINKLVDKGVFPKELKAEYEPMEEKMSPYEKMRKALPKKGQDAWDKSANKDKGKPWVKMRKKGSMTSYTVQKGTKDYDKYKKMGYSEEVEDGIPSFKDFVDRINNK